MSSRSSGLSRSSEPRVHDPRTVSLVAELLRHELIDQARRDDAVAVVDRVLAGQQAEASGLRQRLAELGAYVGGAFVAAAAALFLFEQWASLGLTARIALLAGIAVVLAVAGLVLGATGGGIGALRGNVAPVRRRLASVLFTAAAAAATGAVAVWATDLANSTATFDDDTYLPGLLGSLTMVVLAIVGYRLAPTVLGQVAIAGGVLYAVPSMLDAVGDVQAIPAGLLVLAVGLVWLVLAERRLWSEVAPARLIGVLLAVVGAQIPLGSDAAWVAYLATVLVAVAGFWMYVVRRAWPYLAGGVAAVTLVVPEALLDWTEGSLGTAGVLLVAGATLLVASVLALRLRTELTESTT